MTEPLSPAALPQPPELPDEIVRVLFDRGPLDVAALSEALGEDADDPAWSDELDEALEELDRVVELPDGRLADAPALLQRCTLTRRLTDAEAAGGYLQLDGDLYALEEVVGDSVPLARGGRARVRIGRLPGGAATERLVGPRGWLGDAAGGDLIGLRLTDALLHVTVRPTPTQAGPAARALAAAAGPLLDASDFDPPRAGIGEVLWTAATADPDAFDGVLSPLSEVTAKAGLRLAETMVLPAHADLEEHVPISDLIADLAARVTEGAEEEALDDLTMLRDLTRRLERGETPSVDPAAAADALADPDVLDLYLRQPELGEGAAVLGSMVAEVASRTAQAAGRFLQAHAARAAGDMRTAERHLTEALHADPDFVPALGEAARFADVRGDAPAALRLLGRAGGDDTERAERLRRCTATAGTKVGRNDPCPCGSGRKSKRCCGDRPGGGLPQRAVWLLEKVFDSADGQHLERRLTERLEAAGHLSDWVEEGAGHAVVEDVAFFDLGLLDDFLEHWGPLLPADERELAGSWRDTRRGLYDVRAARGQEVRLRDRATGATVTARVPGVAPPRDTTLLARLLPDGGGGWLLCAGVRVRNPDDPGVARSVDPAADPLSVAEVWAAGRPVLTITEGEPMVACTWEAPLDAEAAERLGKALRDRGLVDDEPGTFVEVVEVDGQARIRGTVTLTGDAVRVETNAEARLARLTGYVREAVGDVEAVVDRRTPMWRAIDDQRRFGVLRPPPEPTPEQHAVLDEVMREQERRWVGEAVPALGGLTPREARDHPTGRPALEELLASLDRQPGGFDPDRLRTLLDLPARGRKAERAAGRAGDHAAARKEARARRAFAFPRLAGDWEGIDVGALSPADEDDRWLLVEAEHELEDCWAPDDPHHQAGGEHEPHYAMHVAVASQLLAGEPPQLWATAQRLLWHGYERHEVLHMLASAFAAQLWLDGKEQEFNHAGYVERLEELPESWEQTREEGGPGRPRGRRRPPAGHGRYR